MNKDIRKYITNCVLCRRDKAKVQQYPLQMTEIPDRPFNKIAIDLVTNCKTSTSGNKHILTVIDHLTGWPEAFPIPDRSADTIVATLINHYLLVHMCPRYIPSDNGTEFKNNLMDQESPLFLVYGRDPNLPLHQLLEPMQCFLGGPDSGKLHLETHRLALAIAKKTLDENRFTATQKTVSRDKPTFQIGDRVYFKNKQPGKWDLK